MDERKQERKERKKDSGHPFRAKFSNDTHSRQTKDMERKKAGQGDSDALTHWRSDTQYTMNDARAT